MISLHSFPTRRSSDLDFEELEIAIYKEDDKVLIEEPSGDVAEMEEATFNQDFAHRVDFLVDPFDTLEDFDERSEEHTSELQSRGHLVCRLLLEKKNRR